MKLKFNIGDKVKHEGEEGEVISIQVSADGVTYTITSKEIDVRNKTIIEGVKHVQEDVLEGVKE